LSSASARLAHRRSRRGWSSWRKRSRRRGEA